MEGEKGESIGEAAEDLCFAWFISTLHRMHFCLPDSTTSFQSLYPWKKNRVCVLAPARKMPKTEGPESERDALRCG